MRSTKLSFRGMSVKYHSDPTNTVTYSKIFESGNEALKTRNTNMGLHTNTRKKTQYNTETVKAKNKKKTETYSIMK